MAMMSRRMRVAKKKKHNLILLSTLGRAMVAVGAILVSVVLRRVPGQSSLSRLPDTVTSDLKLPVIPTEYVA